MRRVAIVFSVLAALLLADGAYLVLTNNQVGGNQGSFFGNPNVVLSAGSTVLIAGGVLAAVAVVMWLAAFRQGAARRQLPTPGQLPAQRQLPADREAQSPAQEGPSHHRRA